VSVVPIEPTLAWAGVAGRAVHRSLLFASPGAARRRSPKFESMGVPVPSRSPGMGAHAALDELVVAGFHAVKGPVDPAELDRIAAEADAAIARLDRSGVLADPAALHAEPGPPAEVTLGRAWVGPTRYETLRFDSGWRPPADHPGRDRWTGVATNDRVRALMLRHRGEHRPWVVCVHGAEMGGRPLIDTRILRAEHLHRALGLNVVLPVLPMHGPRRPHGADGPQFPGVDLVDALHGLAQSAWDLRRLLAWIRTKEPSGVGLTGFSLGGYVAALVAALEPSLDVVVAGCPAVDLPSLLRRGARGPMRDDERFAAVLERGEVVLRPVSPLALAPGVPAGRCHVYAGLVDRLADPVEQAAALASHWGDCGVLWFDGGHVTAAFTGEVTRFVDAALASHLPAA
jgi:hypothetical protein